MRERRALRILRYLWASPTTALGLVLALIALLSRGHAQIVDGVLEVRGGLVGWCLSHSPFVKGGVAAMTLGHVVVGRSSGELQRTRFHERVHVAQTERWGPFFLPAYFACSAYMALRGRDPYRANPFEVEAYTREAAHRRRERLT